MFYLSIDFIFNWYLTPTLYDEKYFILVYANIFNIGINNLKLVYSQFGILIAKWVVFTQKFIIKSGSKIPIENKTDWKVKQEFFSPFMKN